MINKDLSRILGFGVSEGGIRQAIMDLNRDGRIDQKMMMEIIILLLEREEAREHENL